MGEGRLEEVENEREGRLEEVEIGRRRIKEVIEMKMEREMMTADI